MRHRRHFALSQENNVRFISDETYIRMHCIVKLHYCPDFKHPCTFNEKLRWYKPNYHNLELPLQADKYEVRSFVEERIGEQHLVPLYGILGSAAEIDINRLFNRFMLKCSHDSQSTFVCTDRATFDVEDVRGRLTVVVHRNWYWQGYEWAYFDKRPIIVAKIYLNELDKETPIDYKLYCFDGKVVLVQTDTNCFTSHDIQYFLPGCVQCGDMHHVVSDHEPIVMLANRELMLELSEKLLTRFSHARVGWYNIDGKLFFGEMTFYTGGVRSFLQYGGATRSSRAGVWRTICPIGGRRCRTGLTASCPKRAV